MEGASTATEGDLGTEDKFVSFEDVAKTLVPLELEKTTYSNMTRDLLCPV